MRYCYRVTFNRFVIKTQFLNSQPKHTIIQKTDSFSNLMQYQVHTNTRIHASVWELIADYLYTFGLAHADILVLIAYTQNPPINAHAGTSSVAQVLNFDLSLHPYPWVVNANSEGSAQARLNLRCPKMRYISTNISNHHAISNI